jgi:regulatory protein YycH of two-component signal transduction system YycFG
MNDTIIEKIYAEKYNTNTTSRKDIGDIYVDGVPINIKSSHVNRNNYSPNLISADKLFNHLSNQDNNLKFMFVTYDDNNIIDEKLINAEHILWDCLDIRCQGKGVIQLSKSLKIDNNQTREYFLKGLSKAYKVYITKERKKLNLLEEKYCK